MEKRYKVYKTKIEHILYVVISLLIIGSAIWMILSKEYYLLLSVFAASGIVLFSPREYRLTKNEMLDVLCLFGKAFKPISVTQIIRVTQKSKNEAILVYNRDGLRGDRILCLSETDMKVFLDELKKRNPAIEIHLLT
ncbi:MAG: hypothetical protein Q4G63_02640 [Bacteroidia bacterium]|nr:hypothetical protein [Bacteroidia bacterium]